MVADSFKRLYISDIQTTITPKSYSPKMAVFQGF